jgi:hypothetical protein
MTPEAKSEKQTQFSPEGMSADVSGHVLRTWTPIDAMPGYIPMQLRANGSEVEVDWCFAGNAPLLGPFFDNSIQELLTRPFNRLFRPSTGLAMLEKLVQSGQCAMPAAFIFHLSRCGSTLLAQMFAADASNIVLSEAPPLDRILRARIEPDLKQHWFYHMLLALARKRDDRAKRAIVKCDSWHIKHLPLIAQTFPGVPWLFLFRDPLEVMVSNLTQRSAQTLPGAVDNLPEGVSLMDALHMPDEQFIALKIACIMRDALSYANRAGALFVNYRDLANAAFPRILAHFALTPDAQALATMLEKTKFYAKQPSTHFTADSAQKRASASALARHYNETLLMPLYQQLEQLCWRPEL